MRNEIIPQLPSPLNTIVIENEAGSYKDFEVGPDDDFPMKGATYPVDYGYIPGYIGEDGHDLDFFVGSKLDGLTGNIIMYRKEGTEVYGEHKFYIALTADELEAILKEFKHVVLGQAALATVETLIDSIQSFKNEHNVT